MPEPSRRSVGGSRITRSSLRPITCGSPSARARPPSRCSVTCSCRLVVWLGLTTSTPSASCRLGSTSSRSVITSDRCRPGAATNEQPRLDGASTGSAQRSGGGGGSSGIQTSERPHPAPSTATSTHPYQERSTDSRVYRETRDGSSTEHALAQARAVLPPFLLLFWLPAVVLLFLLALVFLALFFLLLL